MALSRGMRAFQISAARGLNALNNRCGRVFADRYHLRVISSPKHLRNALNYVFGNWRHHGYDRDYRCDTRFDPYSSAITFGGFRELSDEEQQFVRFEPNQIFGVALPRTWLLRGGWNRGGGLL